MIAVYDLGGGTFDISILARRRRVRGALDLRRHRTSAARTSISGIMDWLIDEFQRETGIDLRDDRMALQRLKEAAERAKHELSVRSRRASRSRSSSSDAGGRRSTSTRCSPAHEFETMVEDLDPEDRSIRSPTRSRRPD